MVRLLASLAQRDFSSKHPSIFSFYGAHLVNGLSRKGTCVLRASPRQEIQLERALRLEFILERSLSCALPTADPAPFSLPARSTRLSLARVVTNSSLGKAPSPWAIRLLPLLLPLLLPPSVTPSVPFSQSRVVLSEVDTNKKRPL